MFLLLETILKVIHRGDMAPKPNFSTSQFIIFGLDIDLGPYFKGSPNELLVLVNNHGLHVNNTHIPLTNPHIGRAF